MADPAPKESGKRAVTTSSGKAIFEVQKISKKGHTEPRQLVLTKESLQCVSSGTPTWTSPAGTIVSFDHFSIPPSPMFPTFFTAVLVRT